MREVVAVCECALVGCGDLASHVVAHPGRPEPSTPLCAYHASNAVEAGAEVEVSG